MSYKGFPFSKTTYCRRKRKAEQLGCDIMDVPDGRGKHGNHTHSSRHYRWNQGRMNTTEGYIKVRVGKEHPLADPNGYALEHLIVWLSAGQCFYDGDVLHHRNGDKTDNRIENLQRMTKEEHNRLHLPLRDPATGQFISEVHSDHLLDGIPWRQWPDGR